MPSDNVNLDLFTQTVVVYVSSAALAIIYFRYLAIELELPQLKMYRTKVLLIALCIAFFLAFGITYAITRDIHFSRFVFDIIPIIAAFYFAIQTVRFLMQKWKQLTEGDSHYGAVIIAGHIGIVFMATMPIADIFDKTLTQHVLNISLVTVSLIVTFYAYMKNHFRQSKLEYKFLNKIGYLEKGEEVIDIKEKLLNYNLTARELDIALQLLDGKKYKEISEAMFLQYNTISKHGSNIFKKTNSANKNEFLLSFSK